MDGQPLQPSSRATTDLAADATQLTRLLAAASAGDSAAIDKVFPMVYAELLSLARRQMRGQARGAGAHTLQPTALVHEAWMRLAGGGVSITDRAHFWAVAAVAMRQILVDHARRKRRAKRGGGHTRVALDAVDVPVDEGEVDVLALDEALTRLSTLEPRLARTVELRYFGGLSVDEAAAVLGVGSATVKRDWSLARAWLRRELDEEAA